MRARSFFSGVIAGTLLGAAIISLLPRRVREELMADMGDRMERMLPRGSRVLRRIMGGHAR